jgi:hypothetical protein
MAKRGPRTHPEVRAAIRDLAGRDYSGPAIQRALESADEYAHLRDSIPELRTIQNIARGARPAEPGQPWRLASMPAGDVELLRPVIRRMIQAGDWPSIELANWIVRIRQLVPGLQTHHVLLHARRLEAAEREGELTELRELEIQLLLDPWTWRDDMSTYLALVEDGTIQGRWYDPGGVAQPPNVDVPAQRERVAKALRRNRQ